MYANDMRTKPELLPRQVLIDVSKREKIGRINMLKQTGGKTRMPKEVIAAIANFTLYIMMPGIAAKAADSRINYRDLQRELATSLLVHLRSLPSSKCNSTLAI